MLCILIVEDDPLLAFSLGEMLEERLDLKVTVAPTVARAEQALTQGGVRFALLDINIGRTTTYDFARSLKAAQIPFAFTSGADRNRIPDDLKTEAFVSKPCDFRLLESLIKKSISESRRASG